jgi:hypothetical protein
MTEPKPGVTYRPDAETRARLETFAVRENRSLSNAVDVLVKAALDLDERVSLVMPTPRSQSLT